jgi:hypothetical protein
MKLNLDKAKDLEKWIKIEEKKRSTSITPIFWKRLKP